MKRIASIVAAPTAGAVALVALAATASGAGGPSIHVSPTRIAPTKPVTVTFRTRRRLKPHEFYVASVGRPKPDYPPTCVDTGRAPNPRVVTTGAKVTIKIRPIGVLGPHKPPHRWCSGPATIFVDIEQSSGGTTSTSDSDQVGEKAVRFLRH